MTEPVDVRLLQKNYQALQEENDHLRQDRHNGGGGGNPPGGDMEKRIEKIEAAIPDLQLRLVRIESRLEQTATKADIQEFSANIYKAMNEQTWKFIGAATALAAIAFTAARFLH